MNVARLHSFMNEYKEQFSAISQRELYKWQAVKRFQDEWDPDKKDFKSMLMRSLSATANLMDSGNYFPRRTLLRIAAASPDQVKAAFLDLYDENTPLIARIHAFREGMKQLNRADNPDGKNDFQDQRAVMVYLCMRYPESYYLYKYKMLESACEKLEIGYTPKIGADENIVQYLNLCEFVRNEILEDDELLKLHSGRLSKDEYSDPSLTILTQDFIYAVTEYLSGDSGGSLPVGNIVFVPVPPRGNAPSPSFTVSFTDYVSLQRRRKQLGVRGELLVLQVEKRRVGKQREHKVIHVSQSEGDGAGYDIRSVADDESPIFIEVKSTTGGLTTPFEVTRNELAFSEENADNYRLYRLYDFDERRDQAKCFVVRGSLAPYCDCPTTYRVHLSDPAT